MYLLVWPLPRWNAEAFDLASRKPIALLHDDLVKWKVAFEEAGIGEKKALCLSDACYLGHKAFFVPLPASLISAINYPKAHMRCNLPLHNPII